MLKKFLSLLGDFSRSRKWEIAGAALLLFVVVINIFPAGYIIDGGDVVQYLNLKEQYLNKVFYDEWMLGRTSLFYGIFYLLDALGVSDTSQISWYLLIFLLGSFFSFVIFCNLLFSRVSGLVVSIVSIFYATNIYTLYVFTATWGFTPYQLLYIFIPILTALYIKALLSSEKKYVFWFLLVVFFASSSYSNPAFAVSTAIYFFLLTIFLFLFRLIKLDKEFLKKTSIVIVAVFLLNAYWILPLIPKAQSGVEALSSSETIVLPETLRKTSNAIFDSIRLMQTHEREVYYPENFPYPALEHLKEFLSVLALVPFFIVLVGLFLKRERVHQALYSLFFSLLVVFIMLVARVRFPFDDVNNFLFQLPVMNALRGYDKLAIFTPFLLSALLIPSLIALERKKYFKISMGIFFAVILLLSLPFYFGGIQTKMSHMLRDNEKKDYRDANYSALVEIPAPYHTLNDIFKQDTENNKISMLPYSPGSSVGKVSLPEWKVNGPSIARVLYDKEYVELSEQYIPGWVFAEEFDDTSRNPQWIVDLYGLIGVKYIIYHKDAKTESVEEMERSRKYLESVGAIRLVTENDWFRLYVIEGNRVFPYVYSDASELLLADKAEGLSDKIRNFQTEMTVLRYKEGRRKSVLVSVETLKKGSSLFLNEKYDPLWRAKYVSPQGKTIILKRNKDIQYANAWKIKKNFSGGEIRIYYTPLLLMHIGMFLSGITLFVLIFGGIYSSRRDN